MRNDVSPSTSIDEDSNLALCRFEDIQEDRLHTGEKYDKK